MENNNTTENKPKSIKKRRATKILLFLYVVALILHFIPALASSADGSLWEEGREPLWNEVECQSWFDSQNISYTSDYMCINLQYSLHDEYQSVEYTTYYFGFDSISQFTYDGDYIVLSNTHFDMKYGRTGRTWVNSNNEVVPGLIPAGFQNSFALNYIRDSITLKFKEDMSDIYINDVHYSSEIVYYRYHIGDIESKYCAVHVNFTPVLSGNVNREVSINGSTSMLSELKVSVQNVGSNSVQYSLAIYEKNGTTSRNGSSNPDIYYGDDPVYVYYTNDWVYGEQINADSNGIYTNVPIEYQKPTEWHYLAGNTSDNFTIKFTQINLKQGVEYTVVVQAVDCPYDKASLIPSTAEYLYAGIDFSAAETVYSSDFVMLQYDDVVYNPEDDSNGVLPYNGYEGNGQSNLYGSSYNAFGVDGNIFYEPHKGSTGSNFGSSFFPNNSGSQYNSLLSQSSSAFGFIGTVLSWFPSDIFSVVNACLWLGVFIFLIKSVR